MVLRFFLLSIFLFMSCAEGERDNPYDPESKDYRPWGSSPSGQSSSAVTEFGYCVFISDRVCLAGPLSSCPSGGALSNSCPYGSSSSSSSITYTLVCASVPTVGIAGTAITAPAVTCNGATVSSGLSWTGAPYWSDPTAGTYSNVSVSASSGGCSGKTATCSGTLTISSLVVYGTPVNYGGESYKTVVIGNQTWMARNLNYAVEGSRCYGEGGRVWDEETGTYSKTLSNAEIEANCEKYGRLYDWATAMALPADCNSSECASRVNAKHQDICPSGWHIPSFAEWNTLINFVGSSTAGKKLKATSGWVSGGGTDNYGFSALPGGYGNSDGYFYDVGNYGYWWSSSEPNSSHAYTWYMYYYHEYADFNFSGKSYLYSVRCLQD